MAFVRADAYSMYKMFLALQELRTLLHTKKRKFGSERLASKVLTVLCLSCRCILLRYKCVLITLGLVTTDVNYAETKNSNIWCSAQLLELHIYLKLSFRWKTLPTRAQTIPQLLVLAPSRSVYAWQSIFFFLVIFKCGVCSLPQKSMGKCRYRSGSLFAKASQLRRQGNQEGQRVPVWS